MLATISLQSTSDAVHFSIQESTLIFFSTKFTKSNEYIIYLYDFFPTVMSIEKDVLNVPKPSKQTHPSEHFTNN